MKSLEDTLSPSSGSLPAIEGFLDLLNSLHGIIESTLNLGKLNSSGDEIYHNKKSYIPSATQSFSDISEENFSMNVVVSAFNKTSLMADYSFPRMISLPDLVRTLKDRSLEYQGPTIGQSAALGSYVPRSFISVSPSPFSEKSTEVYQSMSEQDSPIFSSNKLAPTRARGAVIEVSSYSKFINSPQAAKQQMSNKVNLLKSPGADSEALVNKGELQSFQSVPKLGGSITLGVSVHGANFSSPIDLIEINENLTNEGTVLPEGIRSAISSAVYKGDDRDIVLDSIKDNYKDLSQTKEQLGAVFDRMYNLFASTKELNIASSQASDYKQKVLGTSPTGSLGTGESEISPFAASAATPMITGPAQKKSSLVLDKLVTSRKISNRSSRKFVMVSLEQENEEGSIPVNNTFLLEV